MIRLTAYASGRVQRTGYRAKVVSLAKEMGLVGFVQNRPDGQVLVIAEGERKDLDKFASALRIKNAIIDVENVSLQYSQGSGQYSSFKKITGPDEIGERLDDGIEILKELVVVLKDVKEDTSSIKDLQVQMLDNQNKMLDKQDKMLDKQDEMLDTQDKMLDKQDTTIGILKDIKEDTKSINTGISELKKDTMDSILEKYFELSREIAEIKATLSEIKAKAS
jgi:acylphosphatase